MSGIPYSRRRVLQALGAIPLTLPVLPWERLVHAGPPETPPKRLVLVMQNNGTQQANFWPDANLRSPILDSLFLDPKTGMDNGLKAKTNIIKGVYIPNDANGTNGNQHDMGFARLFTGAKLISRGGQPWGGAASVDQLLAQAWKVDSLTLAVLASQTEPHPKPGFDHRESFSYLGPATLKHPRKDPLEVWNYLFPPAPSNTRRRKSILDAVAGNLAEVQGRLGPAERAKLDYHLTAIRDVEQRLNAPASSCPMRPDAPPDYLALDANAEVSVDTYIPQMVDDMLDLAVLGLKCGLTRIATVQLGYGGGKWRFGWKGINLNCHDDVAHLDILDGGVFAENTRRVVLMNQYYASCVARLATALDAIPEGAGTMLDNTLVVWANELGRGDHNQNNVPIVLIGKAGGAIARGGRVLDSGKQVFNRLGCTILNAMGVSAAGFGDVPDCGVFPGLL
ncbi:MAG TPA: DUF1552 domain-containing protein [Pseudomonadota bacterium]|nr:DUF1552 domain-containing protein [Pseudomonadota bacterium]